MKRLFAVIICLCFAGCVVKSSDGRTSCYKIEDSACVQHRGNVLCRVRSIDGRVFNVHYFVIGGEHVCCKYSDFYQEERCRACDCYDKKTIENAEIK